MISILTGLCWYGGYWKTAWASIYHLLANNTRLLCRAGWVGESQSVKKTSCPTLASVQFRIYPKTFPQFTNKTKLNKGDMIRCLLTEWGRARQENIWLLVMLNRPRCTRSIHHTPWHWGRYFPVWPSYSVNKLIILTTLTVVSIYRIWGSWRLVALW